jgi:hypothetical protein
MITRTGNLLTVAADEKLSACIATGTLAGTGEMQVLQALRTSRLIRKAADRYSCLDW